MKLPSTRQPLKSSVNDGRRNVNSLRMVPTHITRKIGLSHLRVYVTAENLFTCTGYSGYDPEVSFWNRLIPGLDYTNYPRARSVFFGFSIKY